MWPLGTMQVELRCIKDQVCKPWQPQMLMPHAWHHGRNPAAARLGSCWALAEEGLQDSQGFHARHSLQKVSRFDAGGPARGAPCYAASVGQRPCGGPEKAPEVRDEASRA